MTDRDCGRGPSRALGLWERVIVTNQRRSGMSNITSQIAISTKSELSDDKVVRALKSLTKRHPLLRCVTGCERGVTSFIINDSDPVLRQSEESDSCLVMENELLEIFDDEKYMWRVTRLKAKSKNGRLYNGFVFTFHHAIVDGNSVVQIYRDFVTFLEKELREMDYNVESLPLKQSRDVVFSNRSSGTLSQRLRHALTYLCLDCFYPAVRANALVDKMIRGFRPEQPTRRTRCVQMKFDRNQTNIIIETCRRNDVRVNAFISALVARSFHQLLLQYHVVTSDEVVQYSSECYVNMRRFTESLNCDDIGLYMTHVPIPVRLTSVETSFWQDAKLYDGYLHDCLNTESFLQDYRLFQNALKTLGPRTVASAITLTDHRSMPYYISNLGKIDIVPEVEADEHVCRFEELYQTVGEYMRLSDGSVFIHSVVTVNGCLFWTLGYHAHQVSDIIAQQHAASIKTMAIQVCPAL